MSSSPSNISNISTISSTISSNDGGGEMWKSKLGTLYPKDFMTANESKFNHELQTLRHEACNRDCADCGTKESVMWASVNLGVFLCIPCGSHHRSIGTHISKPKGCTGTYWWGPDELERMRTIGNARASQIYGNAIPPGLTPANTMEWRRYITDKYVHKKYAPGAAGNNNGNAVSGPAMIASTSPTALLRRSLDARTESSLLPSPIVKKDAADLLTFDDIGGNSGGGGGGGGENFFANFGSPARKASSFSFSPTTTPTPTPTTPIQKKNVDLLLGLHHQHNSPASVTTTSSAILAKPNFFAEFGV